MNILVYYTISNTNMNTVNPNLLKSDVLPACLVDISISLEATICSRVGPNPAILCIYKEVNIVR